MTMVSLLSLTDSLFWQAITRHFQPAKIENQAAVTPVTFKGSKCLPSLRHGANVMTRGEEESEIPILGSHLADPNVLARPLLSVY
jgi:hypothetical protein